MLGEHALIAADIFRFAFAGTPLAENYLWLKEERAHYAWPRMDFEVRLLC